MGLLREAGHGAVVVMVGMCVGCVMVGLVECRLVVVFGESVRDVQEDLRGEWLKCTPSEEWDAIWPHGRVVGVSNGLLHVFASDVPLVLGSG